MASKYWQEIRKLNVLGKLRNKITLPAFAVRSGHDNGSVFFNSRQTGAASLNSTSGSELSSVFTFEICYKTFSAHATKGVIFCNVRTIGANSNIEISFYQNKVLVRLYKGASYSSLTSASNYTTGAWSHLAVTWDGTAVKIFLDGVEDANTLSIAAALDVSANGFYTKRFGADDASASFYVGYLAECRIWNIARTQAQLNHYKNKRLGLNSGLKWYFRFGTEPSSSLQRYYNYIDGTTYVSAFAANEITFDDEEYPTLIQGASCLAGIFDVVLDQKVSLKYPCRIPSGADFMLCVSYIDEDTGLTVRYRLWDMDGISVAVNPTRYRGEVLPEVIRFEIWGVDGAESCTMASAYIIHFSKCSLPTTSRDNTQVAIVTSPTLDNTIAAAWPLTFPQSFIEEQHGTVAVPVVQDITDMSADLTNYASIQ